MILIAVAMNWFGSLARGHDVNGRPRAAWDDMPGHQSTPGREQSEYFSCPDHRLYEGEVGLKHR